MKKNIPIYFDSVIVSSPLQEISENNPNIGRLKVRAFTKYANRNGSYITDEVAEQLIQSATSGQTPVIGFFDPETQTWASHTGPTLANGYGYVEDFLGWEPFTDTDGVTRDYAVFSVILFTKYFEEAKNILGQNQSMELDPESITGDWAVIGDNEYYVYTTAKMLGFCVIGSHEPCFSVSAFFAKNDDTYKTQYEKFSSLLSDLKMQVEETQKFIKGGESQMIENEMQPISSEDTEIVEDTQETIATEVDNFQAETEEDTSEVSESTTDSESVEVLPEDTFQKQYDELMAAYSALQQDYEKAQSDMADLTTRQADFEAQLNTLRTENEQLQASVTSYQEQLTAIENNKKATLVEKYEKIISDAEEITRIKESINDFSYDELESKLAILFANQQLTNSEESEKVPLPELPESQFALLMKKYRKN